MGIPKRNSNIRVLRAQGHTLAAIGALYGLTRERIRQICPDRPQQSINLVRKKIDTRIWAEIADDYKIEKTLRRFWNFVDRRSDNECWPWTGPTYHQGYGVFSSRAFVYHGRYAHRMSFYLAYGHWPENWVLHRCNNPGCVNPAHLYDGTPKQNTADAIRKHGQHWLRRQQA